MKPHIGISDAALAKSISILATVLSDEMTLYIKTRKFHWNVSGETFMELHKLFEGQYGMLERVIDEIAERINKLGGKTIGTMNEFLSLTSIVEAPGKYPDHKAMLKELLADNEHIVVELRKVISDDQLQQDDAGTVDYLTGLIQEHESIAWVFRRYLN